MSSRMNSARAAENAEHQAVAGSSGSERFVQWQEADPATAQADHDRDPVLQGAAEPVEGGDDEQALGPRLAFT